MAGNLEELIIQIQADISGVKESLDKMDNEVRNSSNKVGGHAKAMGTAFLGFGKVVAGVAVAGAAAIAGVSGAISKVGISYNAMMEQSQIAWTTLLGDTKKAQDELKTLQKLGKDTPFEFEGLDKAAKTLYMAKFQGDQLTEALTKVGDAVSAVGGNQDTLEGVSTALFQMQAKGKVQAEEMMQLAERGLPVWDILAKKMGKSTSELMDMSSKGQLLAKDVVPLLVDGMGERFAGAMDKQSKTWNGMMSTMKDDIKIIAGGLTKNMFENLQKSMTDVLPVVDAFSSVVSGEPKQAMDTLTKAFGEEKAKQILKTFEKIQDGLKVFKDITSQVFSTAFSIVSDSFGRISAFLGEYGPQIGDMLSSILGTALEIWQTVAPLLQETFFTVFGAILDFWDKYGKQIGDGISSMFQTVYDVAEPILTFVGEKFLEVFGVIVEWWKKNGAELFDNFVVVFNGIGDIIQKVMPAIQFVISMVFDSIKNIITGVLDTISGVFKIFAGLFQGDWGKVWDGVKQTFEGVFNLVMEYFSFKFVGRLLGKFTEFGGSILKSGKEAFEGLFKAISKKVDDAASAVGDIIGAITKPFTSLPKKMIGFAKDTIDGFVGGLRDMASKVKEKMMEIIDQIPDVVKKILGIKSPSRVMKQLANYTVEGYVLGLQDGAGDVLKQAKQLGNNAYFGAKDGVNAFNKLVDNMSDANASINIGANATSLEDALNTANSMAMVSMNTKTSTQQILQVELKGGFEKLADEVEARMTTKLEGMIGGRL